MVHAPELVRLYLSSVGGRNNFLLRVANARRKPCQCRSEGKKENLGVVRAED